MGGYGSGIKFNKKQTLEGLRKLDVRLLKKQGALTKKRAGTLSWTVNGKLDSSINYRLHNASIRLNFKCRGGAFNELVNVKQVIALENTPCHFGGERTWFVCPRCRQRVGILYPVYGGFFCRRCNGLAYKSNNAGKLDRLINKKHKLGEKIFEGYENGFDWTKKKHMHQRTFLKLSERYHRIDEQIDAAIAGMWCG